MSERADRFYTTLADWFPSLLMLGCGALLVVPMGEGDPEHGFFMVVSGAASVWLVQCVVTLYERRKQAAAWREPLLLVKGCLIVAIVVAALIRGHVLELVTVALVGGSMVLGIGLLGAAVLSLLRCVETKLERWRRSR